jgi:hypothetical protein
MVLLATVAPMVLPAMALLVTVAMAVPMVLLATALLVTVALMVLPATAVPTAVLLPRSGASE